MAWSQLIGIGAVLAFGLGAPGATALEGTRQVYLVAQDGTRHAVAEITFESAGTGYGLRWNDDAFEDAFLSMRPFKCLMGPEKHWCRVPYPYENARSLGTDLTDLEYDLLFVWKGATEYGIDLWNGVYYRLSAEGDAITGAMHEIDMNILAAPPEAGELRPIGAGDLEPADPESHWLPMLRIE